MRIWSILWCFVLLAYCSKPDSVSRKKIGESWVEAHFTGDKILNGQAKFFDKLGRLTAIKNYRDGLEHGLCLNFHSNGKVYDSVNFNYGLKDGYRYIFDSLGTLGYTDYFYQGSKLGPEFYYENGKVSLFEFKDFEKRTLYSISYDSAANAAKLADDFVFPTTYYAQVDGQSEMGLFAYLIHPPHIDLDFSLVGRDSTSHKEQILKELGNRVILDTTFQPSPKVEYFLKVDVFDESRKKQMVHYYELF